MTQENEPKGSKSPDGFSGKCEHPADGKATAPLKKRVRFWGSDGLKEVTDNKTEGSSANHNDVKVSSTSGFTDAREEDKVEIIPIQKRSASTTWNDDKFSASLLQLAISEAELEGTGNEPRAEGGEALEKESKELIEHTAAGGSGSRSQTDTTVPPIRSGQRIEGDRLEEVQEGVTNDGSDGSSAPSREEESKGKLIYRRRRPKQSSSPEENPVQDQSAPEVESGFSGDGLDPTGKHLPKTALEIEGDCSGDAPDVVGVEDHIPKAEGVTKDEDGGGAISATVECETDRIDDVQEAAVKDVKDVGDESGMNQDSDACGKDHTETKGDGGGDGGGNGSLSPTNTITECNNGGDVEGYREEQGKDVAMEDDGLGNISNSAPGNEEPVEGEEKPLEYLLATGQLDTMEDDGNDNNKTTSEPGVQEQSDKGKEPVEADHYEQGQRQTAIEDGGRNVADVVEEVQDRKGKKPMEYYEGFRKYSESKPVNNQNAQDVVGNKEQPNHQGTNPDAGGGSGSGSGLPTFLISSELGDHNDQIQQAAFEDPDGENGNKNADANIAIQSGMQSQQDAMLRTILDIIRKRRPSIHQQGEVSHDVLVAMEDGGNDNIRFTSEPGLQEQSDKGKEPVEADHYEQGQGQTAIEDGGGNVADVVVSEEEVQDRKGKKPMEYYEGFRKYRESKSVNNQNAPDVIGNKEQPNHQGTNPNADGGSGSGPPTFLVSSESGNKYTNANMAIQGGMQSQQDAMLKTILDIIIRKRRRSIREQGDDTPGQEGRKKCKYGSDHGGSTSVQCLDAAVGYNEPPMQQVNHSVMLFGVTIPCEQEPDVAINTDDGLETGSNHAAGGELGNVPPPMQQPTNGAQQFDFFMAREPVQPGVQLFGVFITGEQVQPVEMQNRDQGNSRGHGESSRQRLKSGLRLFGVDI